MLTENQNDGCSTRFARHGALDVRRRSRQVASAHAPTARPRSAGVTAQPPQPDSSPAPRARRAMVMSRRRTSQSAASGTTAHCASGATPIVPIRGMRGPYDHRAQTRTLRISNTIVAISPRQISSARSRPGLDRSSHTRSDTTSATTAYATSMIATSPTLANAQRHVASARERSSMPRYSGACSISHAKLSGNATSVSNAHGCARERSRASLTAGLRAPIAWCVARGARLPHRRHLAPRESGYPPVRECGRPLRTARPTARPGTHAGHGAVGHV